MFKLKSKEEKKKDIKSQLDEFVSKAVNEDWEIITDHRYPTDLRREIKLLLEKARKYGMQTQDYENTLSIGGFNID